MSAYVTADSCAFTLSVTSLAGLEGEMHPAARHMLVFAAGRAALPPAERAILDEVVRVHGVDPCPDGIKEVE